MADDFRVFGAEAFIERLKKAPETIARTTESVLKQEARALCVGYALKSEPMGLTDAAGDKYRASIEKDVRAVYASRQNPGQVYAVLKAHRPDLAAAYWHAHKRGKKRKMGQILRLAGLPTGIDPAALKKARNGRRIRKGTIPSSIATEAQVRAKVKRQQKLVFTAKAGWHQAARALGGRIRTNIVRDGKRTTVETFPPAARRLSRRFPGMGGARISPGRVEIFSNVRHANQALTADKKIQAEDDAYKSLARSMQAALDATLKKIFRRNLAA